MNCPHSFCLSLLLCLFIPITPFKKCHLLPWHTFNLNMQSLPLSVTVISHNKTQMYHLQISLLDTVHSITHAAKSFTRTKTKPHLEMPWECYLTVNWTTFRHKQKSAPIHNSFSCKLGQCLCLQSIVAIDFSSLNVKAMTRESTWQQRSISFSDTYGKEAFPQLFYGNEEKAWGNTLFRSIAW